MVGWGWGEGEGHASSASDKNKENILIKCNNKDVVRYLKSQVCDENGQEMPIVEILHLVDLFKVYFYY
jgi:hypothetical protein